LEPTLFGIVRFPWLRYNEFANAGSRKMDQRGFYLSSTGFSLRVFVQGNIECN
jgi:hypothetical protein